MNLIASLWGRLEEWLFALVESVWALPTLFVTTAVDGFFPPIPGETVIVMLAVAARSGHDVALWAVLLVAAAGAWCGDQIAYSIGRAVGTERVRLLRGPRGRRAVAWASAHLLRRGAAFILAARYVPVGRTAVNVTAGAVRFPRRRFMVISALASALWAAFSVVVGVLAAHWWGAQPLLAVVVGVGTGTLLGVVVDRVVARRQRRPRPLPSAAAGRRTPLPGADREEALVRRRASVS
ncbi:DedA family protein [Oerskovia flava]|uniref:DedA family protein n=1 Tax=Oerskovia flava TaxID=2986422 RepID=UPI002240A197|nr:VTT domain-containing protein [Oerskovia sp. JB1-3-2]